MTEETEPIENHAAIGNMRTAALISIRAELVWYCYPHFDSPSLFASLLDRQRGGSWAVQVMRGEEEEEEEEEEQKRDGDDGVDEKESREGEKNSGGSILGKRKLTSSSSSSSSSSNATQPKSQQRKRDATPRQTVNYKQLYHSETNVLISRFLCEDGVGQCVDFMPVGECSEYAKHRIVRELNVVRGELTFLVDCTPRFDYARERHRVQIEEFGVRFITPRLTMELRTNQKREWKLNADQQGVSCIISLKENETEMMVLCESQPCKANPLQSEPCFRTGDVSSVFSSNGHVADSQHREWKQGRAVKNMSDTTADEEVDASDEPESSFADKVGKIKEAVKRIAFNSLPSSDESTSDALNEPHSSSSSTPASPSSTSSEKLCDCHELAEKNRRFVAHFEKQSELKSTSHLRKHKSPSNSSEESQPSLHPHSITPVSLMIYQRLRLNTINFWRRFIAQCSYKGAWMEVVHRSALILKLMTFEPTGAVVAALSMSLPEEERGERNFDYRFTWLRDASFTLYAFLKLGYKMEAQAFMSFIAKRCEESSKGDGRLEIMYGIHGESDLGEVELDHLSGYKNSKPVRLGNAAHAQVQMDVYGELLDTVYLSNKYSEPTSYSFWLHIHKIVEYVAKHWQEPDSGIWEGRSAPKHYVYSKLMCWVALDRGIRLAEKRSFPADIVSWRKTRDQIYGEIQTRGFSTKLNAYTQSYESDVLDASLLMMPLVFFCAPTDPRIVSTLDQILKSTKERGLMSNNLVYRYNAQNAADGLTGMEGTFTICSFWACEASARLGAYRPRYLEQARFMFEQILTYGNHVGLFGEEIGLSGQQLGNFPQAFTHLSLISAALNLDRAINQQSSSEMTVVL